jgi:hypothetical protein
LENLRLRKLIFVSYIITCYIITCYIIYRRASSLWPAFIWQVLITRIHRPIILEFRLRSTSWRLLRRNKITADSKYVAGTGMIRIYISEDSAVQFIICVCSWPQYNCSLNTFCCQWRSQHHQRHSQGLFLKMRRGEKPAASAGLLCILIGQWHVHYYANLD